VVRKAAYGAKGFARAVLRGKLMRRFVPGKLNAERIVEPEVACGFELPEARAGGGATGIDGLIRHDLTREPLEQDPKDYAKSAIDTNERLLANREKHLVVLNNYGERRAAGAAALGAASMVTPPSDYLRRVLVAMGVPEERTKWVRLGQPHFDQIHRATKRSPFYDERPWNAGSATRPLRIAFLGTTRPNKGLEVLARAIPLLDAEVRRRCHFLIRAGGGGDRWFRKRLSMYPEVSVYGEYDNFLLISARGEYDVGILSHIWLENSPLVLLENLHAGKFTICSRLGGPVDFVKEPGTDAAHPLGNGLFFAGGDEAGLAEAITRVVTGDVELPSAREVHAASAHALQSYPAHVREVETMYRQLLGEKPEQSLPVSVVVGAGGRSAAAAAR
jgi:glycosyltransferase involved in cell wall biosynthesis